MPSDTWMQANIGLFEALNSVSGLSWALDSMIALALDNPLFKAGPICACFLYAWSASGNAVDLARRRRILMVTLASLFLIAPTSKLLSEQHLSPRPFLFDQQVYTLEDGSLEPHRRVDFDVPRTGDVAARVKALHRGEVSPNDFVSFPSDHAAFFTALSLGILVAARRPGIIALGWTMLVTLGSRIAAGMHWPIDIAAGAGIGAMMLLLLLMVGRSWGAAPLGQVVTWTQRHEALSGAILFLLLLEAANAMKGLHQLKAIMAPIWGRLL